MPVLLRQIIYLASFICCIQLTYAKHIDDETVTNTPNQVATPTKDYPILYTIHSATALLERKNAKSFQLVLEQVFNTTNFKQAMDHEQKTSLLNTRKFIDLWQTYYREELIAADITGIQVNNKTIGHTQFYIRALLGNPFYDAKKEKLYFHTVKLLTPIHIHQSARFDNATIFINGCTLSF